ncbi:MAG: hypothetical protein IKJ71_05075, partial [Bacteroidaceae bacterium]|nr:hypothetical protein [Bacteroidaceae bacterium]
APKGHDITTTKRIYDCRLRVSCIKEYKRLFNVLSVLKRYSPYSLQVKRFTERGTSFLHKKRSTPFHKEILPTFTKQLRKNYTIIVPLIKHGQIYLFKY